MTMTEQDIYGTPAILRQVMSRVEEHSSRLAPLLQGPLAFLGCGSSYCIGVAAAALYEQARELPAQGIMASEYSPRAGWTHIAISRTGQTTELIEAMQRAARAGAPIMLIRGEPGSPAEPLAGTVLPLEFAPEQGVVQTRFITAATLALRLLIGGDAARHALADLPDRVERGLATLEPDLLARFERVVFLGRGWRYGLALVAALNLQETAQAVPEGHQTLDFRHGPIAAVDAGTLVWCFDAPDDAASMAVLEDVRRTGATVRCSGDDPLVCMVQAQLSAVRLAASRGIDPDAPRHLSRAIVLPAQ